MKIFAYFNLTKKVWSIKALQGPNKGRVIAHAKRVNISGATLKVSEAGRQRVISEKRKNVHAGIVGEWDGHCDASPLTHLSEGVAVSYNPYKGPSFTRRDTGEALHSAEAIHLSLTGAVAYI